MGNPTIKIEGIKSGDQLKLSDQGNTEVYSNSRYRRILWTLKTDEVKLFRIEGTSIYNPFETEIPRQFASRLKLKVRDKEPERDWEYVIYWIDANGVIHRHDPKIAIKSSRTTFAHSHHQSSLKPWLALVLVLLGIALWLTDDKKKDS